MLASLLPLGYSHYLIGGLLIGAGISLLFVMTGRIGGASSVFTTTCSYISNRPYFQQAQFVATRHWRLIYALGMVLGALAIGLLMGGQGMGGQGMGGQGTTSIPWWQLLGGGVIAGVGARMGGGCTSGHGVCGMASLRPASLIAVATFLTTAIVTANVVAFFGAQS